jgi:hypothetical protein
MKQLLFLLFIIVCSTANAQLGWDRTWDIKAHDNKQIHFQLGVAMPVPGYNSDSNKFTMKPIRLDKGLYSKYDQEKDFLQYGAGPVFARFEYGFNRRLSINVGATYTNFKAQFNRDSLDRNINKMVAYEYGVITQNISGIVRLNYHMYIDPRWDLYCGGGIGYDYYTTKSYSKYPPQDGKFNGYIKSPGDYTFEAGFGARYFFLNRTAWYLEAGYGKTYLQTGVVVKVFQPKSNRSY